MKIAAYETKDRVPSFGILEQNVVYDMSRKFRDISELLTHLREVDFVHERSKAKRVDVNQADFLPPISEKSRIFCVAANYYTHAEEMGMQPPVIPVIFSKYFSSLLRPFGEIKLPSVSKFLDYEGELAVVIGKAGKKIRSENARDNIAGFAVINDITARDLQKVKFGTGTIFDWFSSKTLDRCTPLGPCIVTPDELSDDLRIQTKLNDEVVQSESISGMVFSVEKLIEFISDRVELLPGDVIATGTPSGVGAARNRSLRSGDVLEVSIEGVGNLKNRIV